MPYFEKLFRTAVVFAVYKTYTFLTNIEILTENCRVGTAHQRENTFIEVSWATPTLQLWSFVIGNPLIDLVSLFPVNTKQSLQFFQAIFNGIREFFGKHVETDNRVVDSVFAHYPVETFPHTAIDHLNPLIKICQFN